MNMTEQQKKLYLSATWLLFSPRIREMQELYPDVHVYAAARMGLVDLCRKFQPENKKNFFGYAQWYIKNAIRAYLERTVTPLRDTRCTMQIGKMDVFRRRMQERQASFSHPVEPLKIDWTQPPVVSYCGQEYQLVKVKFFRNRPGKPEPVYVLFSPGEKRNLYIRQSLLYGKEEEADFFLKIQNMVKKRRQKQRDITTASPKPDGI